LDLEKELMSAPEEREDGGVYEETPSVSVDVKNTKPERLPGLTCVAAASLSSTRVMFLNPNLTPNLLRGPFWVYYERL
jgi:hypothetical protein